MPVHDWTRVDAEIFHDFHIAWNLELHKNLNTGVLPEDYYALIEQHNGRPIADILTRGGDTRIVLGGIAVTEAPP
jgi:hypothetical protein